MASSEMKLKTLYVMKILLELSDENHFMTASDIGRELKAYGLSADRRSIYNDLEVLERFGLDLVRVPGNRGWYVASREFELPELKILIDAVQVAKFIPPKKSEILIKKLQQFASKYSAGALHRQILLSNPAKSEFTSVYYTVDALHEAMNRNCRVGFQYMEWTEKKQVRMRRGGKMYEVSPWGLMWNDEYYYLLAYDPKINGIKHYRVDRMQNTEREGSVVYENYRINFSRKTFGMYGGDDVPVRLRCANRMAGIIIDRFGQDIMLMPKDDGYFTVCVLITLSPHFFGWLASNETDVEILEPIWVREDYMKFIKNILRQDQCEENF